MPGDAVRVTREELYQQVWSEPMQKLAKKYGLSDVGLAKTCRRMRIPLPGRGYWAKKQFGKPVRRTPLPKVAADAPAGVREFVIRQPTSHSEASELASGPVADQERFEALDENRIRVPDILTDPHPLVARTVIVDALVKALDARGYSTSIRPATQNGARAATVVRIGEEEVRFALSERVDVVERSEATPPQKPSRTVRSPHSWSPLSKPAPMPRRDLVSTGQYSLRIDHSYLGIRCTWSDGKTQRVDQCLNSFIVGLVVAAEKLKQQRLEREAREREWRAAEERRLEEQRTREAEAARIRALDRALSAWRDARDIRQYVAEAREALSRGPELPSDAPILQWLAWAEGYADRVDPLSPEPRVPKDPGPPQPSYGWR